MSTRRPPDIEAEVRFLTTQEGGRRAPVRTGVRTPHDFGLATLNDALLEFIGSEWLALGETVRANLWFAFPEYQEGRLAPGLTFTIHEIGVVGHGVVLRVLNEKLRVPG